MGEAAVRILAERGASIIATDINVELGKQLIKSLQANGTEAIFIKHDVSIEQNWIEVVKTAIDKFGKVDVLVNNAGIIEFTPLSEMTVEQFDKT